MSRPPTGPVALVTGASSGIGWAAAKALAAHGCRVALAARREGRLQELAAEIERAGGAALVVPADLTSEAERQRLVEAVRARWGRIDVLVNNAGFGWVGWTAEMPWPTARRMLAVNVEAVVHLTLLVLPEMVERRTGHIINVGSVAGEVILPPEIVYSATRTFVRAFSEGLYRELRGTGVRVSAVKPGPVKTEFLQVATETPPGARPDIEEGVSAERVGRAIASLLHRPRKSVYIPAFLGLAPVGAFFLGWAFDRLGRAYARRRLAYLAESKAEAAVADA